jgi:hypothetical protein
MALTNAERQSAWRARRADERAHDTSGRRVIGNVYLAPRESITLRTRTYTGVIHECARHGACVFVDITRGRSSQSVTIDGERVMIDAPLVAPVVAAQWRDERYADGVGACHDGAHEDGPVRECTHGGHTSTRVGTHVARTNHVGVDTVATRRAADIDAAHVAHVAECADCRTASRGVTASNTRRADDERVQQRIRPWTRERDALLWAREYAGVIA